MRHFFAAIACLACAGTPAMAKPGYRVVQDRGAWWFQAPDGSKFLSLGVDCVGPGPDTYDAAKPEYSAAKNLSETAAAWRERNLRRLPGWGFNTLGGWCDQGLQGQGMPMTPVLHLQASMGSIWWDLWNYDYPGQAKKLAKATIAPYKGKPGVLGYFLDNELAWADEALFTIALSWDTASPGKKRLVETLKKAYAGDFNKFSLDFSTRAENWDALTALTDTARRDGHGHRAIDAWTYEVARRYYSVLAAAVRAEDPGKLVLGDRFRQFYPQAVARATQGLLDVVSTNYEATTADGWISPCYFQTLHELSGLPILVGEYYATARQNRSGNKNHGGEFTLQDTQAERAKAAAAQARQFAKLPFMLGWHWFQFNDEPTHGRGDGEDYNMGLVDIYDQPYQEVTAALQAENAAAPGLHAASAAALPAAQAIFVARQDGLRADGKLGDWDKSSPLPRAILGTPAPLLPFGDLWLAWDESNLWVAARAYGFNLPGKDEPLAYDESTWGELNRLSIASGPFEFYGATGLRRETPAMPGRDGAPVLFLRPPQKGRLMAAAGSFIDKWYTVWEVAIPAPELGQARLAAGMKLKIKLNLKNRGDFEEMSLKETEISLK